MATQLRPLSKIKKVIVHCSDSDNAEHDNIETINKWHLERGFSKVGYHFVILRDGTVKVGRRLDEVGAHCKGQNTDSVGVCLTGRSGFTPSQFIALGMLKQQLDIFLGRTIPILEGYGKVTSDPLPVYPHNYFDAGKSCPNFSSSLFVTDEGSDTK